MKPLPTSGFAADILENLPESDPKDPNRLASFVDAVAASAEERPEQPEPPLHLVAFTLGEELFALPVERVREVVRVTGLTRVPQAPEHVRGVQSLRGRVLPVLEVKTRLGLPPAVLSPASRVLVAEGRSRLVGLLVDSVHQVTRVPRSAVVPPPPEVRTSLTAHVRAVARLGERTALLLDMEKLLLLPDPTEVSSR